MDLCVTAKTILVVFTVFTGVASPQSTTTTNKLTVATVIETPYVFWRADSPAHENSAASPLQGNAQFDGFLIDLLDRLAKKLNCTYEIQLAKDGQFGWVDEQGMSYRQYVLPNFASSGKWKGMIGELTRKEIDLALAPLTIMDGDAVVDFTIPFMEFGSTIMAKKPQNSNKLTFTNLEELANQTEVDYGVIGGSSTFHFFRTNEVEPFKKMWTWMSTHPYAFVGSFFEAIDRVRVANGKYTAIMETPIIEFASNHFPCDTVKVGLDEIDVKGYALALQKGSQWTARLSQAIKELKDDGTIAQMKNAWWSGPCTAQSTGAPLPAEGTASANKA